MSNSLTTESKIGQSSMSFRAGRILQRKCACGNHVMAGGECAECGKKEHNLQRQTIEGGSSGLNTFPLIPSIQRKLTIGASDDPLEQEADRVADQVMSMSVNPLAGTSSPRIQRFTGPATTETDVVPPSVDRVLASSGHSLEPSLRQDMERRFDYDFSGVRVHSGSAAEQSARDVNAYAYTVGQNIVFGGGQYAPYTLKGSRLLAHELVHTVQQSQRDSRKSVIQRDPQILGGPLREPVSLLTPDIGIIPDFLDIVTITVGLGFSRSLTPAERGILQTVFGAHLNYNLIRICSHTVCSPDGIARTVGNLIATPPSGINNSTLVHEAAHVWQHQNGIRYGYIPTALVAQFGAWILTGSRNAAYNWQIYYDNSVPWMAWNPEAQASFIEHHMTLPPLYVWGTGGFLPVP